MSDLPTLPRGQRYSQVPEHEPRSGRGYEHRLAGAGCFCAAGMAKGAKYLNEDVNVSPCWATAKSRKVRSGEAFVPPRTSS